MRGGCRCWVDGTVCDGATPPISPRPEHAQSQYIHNSRIAALARPVRLPARLALLARDRARAEALFRQVADLAAMLPSV